MSKTRNDSHRAERNKLQTEVRNKYKQEVPENLHEYEAYKELIINRNWNHNVLQTICKRGGDYLVNVVYKNSSLKPYHEVYRNIRVAIWFLQKNWGAYYPILQYFHTTANNKGVINRIDINLPLVQPEVVLINSKGPIGLFKNTRQTKRKMKELLKQGKEEAISFVPQEEFLDDVFSPPEPCISNDDLFSEFIF